MAQSISKECFPKPTECFNCDRKNRQGLTKSSEVGKELKRCAGCHLVTYCDKYCQEEHWNKVHKKHCKFLLGKKVVEGRKHVDNSCSFCVQEKQSSWRDLSSFNSSESTCHVERVIKCMKTMLGRIFKFHGEGKTCSCSARFGCELPFQLGEVTGIYAGFGLDEMLAHALKILNALEIKGGRGNYRLQEKIGDFFLKVAAMRSLTWQNILVYGDKLKGKCVTSELGVLMKELKTSFGRNNAWLDALSFTVSVIIQLTNIQSSMSSNSRSLEDPRFPILKLTQQYRESQLKHYEEKDALTKLKLWPIVSEGSLVILAPEEIHCGNCRALLTGRVCENLYPEENDPRPIIMPFLGELGLMGSCPISGGRTCRDNCIMQNVFLRVQVGGLEGKKDEETQLFFKEVRFCDVCLTASLSSHRCSKCYAAQYCSKECQHQDLAFHMTVCDAWAKDKGRKLVRGKKQEEINATKLKERFKTFQSK